MANPVDAPLFYFVRLIPPRPDFPFTLSDTEQSAMTAHAAYWRERVRSGQVVVAGPVADPAGAWGLGVLRMASEDELRHFQDNDPAILADIGMRYETMTMLSAMMRGYRD
jgi:hypothetical protein